MRKWFKDRWAGYKARFAREQGRRAREQGNDFIRQDRFLDAVKCLEAAVGFDPSDADARVNLGFAWNSLQRWDLAREHLEHAVALAPGNHDALYLLGNCREQTGDLPGSAECLRAAIDRQPDFALAYRDLARVLFLTGRSEEALVVVDEGVNRHPGFADLHFYRGNVLVHERDFPSAIASYQKSLEIDAGQSQVHMALGNARSAINDWEGAAASYGRAVQLSPLDARGHNQIGIADVRRGNLEHALVSFRRAIELDPGLADAYSNLAEGLRAKGDAPHAVQAAERAVDLQPASGAAHNNLGTALVSLGRDALALQSFRRAVELEPESAVFHGNCAGSLLRQGQLEEAVAGFRRAVQLDPGFLHAHSNLLFALAFHPECSPKQYLEEARRYGLKVSELAKPEVPARNPDTASARPLRVGCVSGDLRAHPVGFFLESTVAHLDRSGIELVAYSTRPRQDALTERIRPAFSAWRSLWGVPDQAAAQMIRDDAIDILLDLSGHSEGNRLPLFAWRAAPVQASWLGYFASTGVAEIDYLLADPVSVPAGLESQFTESLWYLPHTRFCFTAPEPHAQLQPGPAPVQRKGSVTFGTFQSPAKIDIPVLQAWSRILARLPGSRLRIQTNLQGLEPGWLQSRLASCGIDLGRVVLAPAVPRHDYLLAHREVDILLDTFPYTGGTTTCEALWMGVPTVTLAGKTMLERQGASLMTCAGLADWVAADVDGYVELAVAKAIDLAGLASTRENLRAQALASPLFDAKLFARDLEAAMRGMWNAKAAAGSMAGSSGA